MDNKKNWYLLQYKPNCHFIAQKNLNAQHFDTFLPLVLFTKRKSSKFVNLKKPLFPGYMFISFDYNNSSWYKINSTVGVSKVVFFNGKPQKVPNNLLYSIMLRCDKFGVIDPTIKLKKGSRVKLISGPFTEFVAEIEKFDSEKRVWVLLDFMNQNTKINVNENQLTSI